MQLHDKYAKDGVACMSVSLDKDKGRTASQALDFLVSKDAAFDNFYLEDLDSLGPKWGFDGGIPLVRVYDRDGKKKGDYHDYDDVIPVVKELVGNGK